MHMTFHVKHAEGIDLEILSNLLKSYNDLNKLLYPEDKVKVRQNIQSPGPIEIVGMAMTVGSIAGLIWNNAPVSSKIASGVKETLKYGGKFSKQKDGFSIEIPNRKESENAQKNEERRLAMEEENHEIKKELLKEELRAKKIENAKSSLDLIEKVNSKLSKEAVNSILEFVDNFEKLGGEYPEEFTKALEKTDLEENKKTK